MLTHCRYTNSQSIYMYIEINALRLYVRSVHHGENLLRNYALWRIRASGN